MDSFNNSTNNNSGSQPPAGNGDNNGFNQGFSNGSNGNQDMSNSQGNNSESQRTTLWMGELEHWMDENFIKTIFMTSQGENVQVKVIRDKQSGQAGYCFVEFAAVQAAQRALAELNGNPVPNSTRTFKLNWATGGGIHDRRDERAPEYSIFVGDLAPDISEFILVTLFQSRFPSCKAAKIMTDNNSGQSRGYGFVRFTSQEDQERALVEMQGVYCGNRPMRISTATPKNNRQQFNPNAHGPVMGGGGGGGVGGNNMIMNGQGMWAGPNQSMNYPHGFPGGPAYPQMNQFTDPNNTTVFVGGLSGYVTEDELRSFFQGFGEITYVKIPPGKGCGFVQFVHRHAAEMAINQMQGYPIGNSRVRLSWGRSQNNSGVGTPYRPAPPPPHYGAGPPNVNHGPHGGPNMYPMGGPGPIGAHNPFGTPGPHMAPQMLPNGMYGAPVPGPNLGNLQGPGAPGVPGAPVNVQGGPPSQQ